MMNRARFFTLPALALSMLLCGGCTEGSEPELTGDIIEFGVPMIMGDAEEEASRAQRLDVLPANEVFGVAGYCVPATAADDPTPAYLSASAYWVNKNRNAVADVTHGTLPVKFDGTKCVYRDADPDHYYEPAHWYLTAGNTAADPADFRYSFIAWHPYEGNFFSRPDEATVGVPELGFTMPFEAGENGELDPTKVKDAMVAFTRDRLRNVDNVGTVPLSFRHILCGLRFQINNFNTSHEVIVHSLSLTGSFYRSATVSFVGNTPQVIVKGDPLPAEGEEEGEEGEEGETLPVPDDTPGIDENDMYSGTFRFLTEPVTVSPNTALIAGAGEGEHASADGVAVLLLPHFQGETDRSYLGRNKKITITYSFQKKNDDGDLEVLSKTLDFTLNRRPAAGTLYTVNLNFVGEQLMVTFSDNANNSWSWDDVHEGNNTIK